MLERDGWRCESCGGVATEVDHVTPGAEGDWNLRALCSRCHRAKTQREALAGRSRMVDYP